MEFKDLPTALKKNKLKHLKAERGRGIPLEMFTQDERDLLHMETSEENVRYWKAENEVAETGERSYYCQSIARNIICALRAMEPTEDDEHPLAHILCNALEEADKLPAVH